MTVFAAVIQKRGPQQPITEVAEAVGSIGGADPSVVSLGSCALLVAPLHHDDPDGPVVLPGGIAVAGQIVLEGRRGLASRLHERTSACSAALIGASYMRWGESCTEHLSGEYAFTLWDSNARTLFCARDGMGLRLLYVADSADVLIVTNVLAAALRHPAIPDDPDDTALIGFLAHGGAIDEVRTPYRHVSVVPAGHTLVVDTGRGVTRMRRHWHFPVSDPAPRRGEASVLEEYRSVLAEAVGDRLSTSRTSVFLSGGVDSTTIAAAAREVAPSARLQAITARYPRYLPDDELQYARAAAESLSLPLTVINADRYDAWHVRGASPVTPSPLDEPMLADWRDVVACAAGYGTVALYGEDGDALFSPSGWRSMRNAGSPGSIAIAVARYAISERRRPYLGLRCRERLGIRRPRRFITPSWLSEDASAALARCDGATILGHAPEALPPHPTRPETQARLTSTTYCRDFASTISADVTRQRVELRFPLFDTRLVRLVVSLPAIPWCQHKALPRRAYRGRLPHDVLDRPKTTLHGFNDALVAAWRRSRPGTLPIPGGKLATWIDHGEWARTLRLGQPEAVMAAWRVLALDTWIAAAQTAAARSSACTP
jgi:asparagine synthetase B (glutamine-hydrolysing)